MKKESLNQKLLKTLKERYSQKNDLVYSLSELLKIEKESVYRRLRGDVQFTLEEAATISKALNISLDTLNEIYYRLNPYTNDNTEVGIEPDKNLGDENYEKLLLYIERIKEVSMQPASEHAQVLGFLTLAICLPYPHILRFLIFRYLHVYENKGDNLRYENCQLSSRISEQFQRMNYYLSNITTTESIWDPNIIQNTVDSIQYFTNVQLISQEDKEKIKKELFQFLDNYEEYATQGYFTKTGNTFNLFISEVHIGFSHAYLSSKLSYMSIFITFVLQTITMLDKYIYTKMREKVHSIEKLSTLISIVAEKERSAFFKKQREIVATL